MRIITIHAGTALAGIGTIAAAVIAGGVPGTRSAGCLSSVACRISMAGIPAVAVAVRLNIGVQLVSFPRPFAHVITERLRLGCLLVRVLAQPRGLNLRLLGVCPGARRLGLTLAGIEFPVFSLPANFGGLLAMCVVPLLLDRLAAPSRCQEQQHNQHHHNNGHYDPNPWSCFHAIHHFHLVLSGRAKIPSG